MSASSIWKIFNVVKNNPEKWITIYDSKYYFMFSVNNYAKVEYMHNIKSFTVRVFWTGCCHTTPSSRLLYTRFYYCIKSSMSMSMSMSMFISMSRSLLGNRLMHILIIMRYHSDEQEKKTWSTTFCSTRKSI